MKDVFLTSSVLILALILLRFLFRRTVSRRVQYALWGLVLLRLLLPVSLPAIQYSVLTAAEPVKQTQTWETVSVIYGNVHVPRMSYTQAYDQVTEEALRAGEDLSAMSDSELDSRAWIRMMSRLTLRDAAHLLWYAGMGVTALLFLLVNLRFARKLRRTRVPLEGAESKYPVYLCDDIPSPCLFGLWKPSIYVTSAAARDPEALGCVLAHEETHGRHLDPLWSLLRSLCLVIWWFNPLVWLAAHLSKIDCELACDEGVLVRLGEGKRIPYGETLLRLVPLGRTGTPLLNATTMTAGKRQMKDRIRRIAERRKPLVIALILVLVLAGTVCACTFTGADKTPPEPAGTAPEHTVTGSPELTPAPTAAPTPEPTREPISLLTDRLLAAADRVFGTEGRQGADFQISVEADGRLDEYTYPSYHYAAPSLENSIGYRMKRDYAWLPLTESEAAVDQDSARVPVLRVWTEEESFTLYADVNILQWTTPDGAVHWFRPEPTGDEVSPLYDCFLGYAWQMELSWKYYDRISVPGTVTDFEEVARQVSEQYAALLLDRPNWCSELAPYGAGVISAELYDAYYGEDFPNFVFIMRLALDVDERNGLWYQAGPGLGAALEDGPYVGLQPWWAETTVGLVDGTWRLLAMGSGGATVWLPDGLGWDFPAEHELSAERLVGLYFLTSGNTHDWRLMYALAHAPAEELLEVWKNLPQDLRENLHRGMETYNENTAGRGDRYGSFDLEAFG